MKNTACVLMSGFLMGLLFLMVLPGCRDEDPAIPEVVTLDPEMIGFLFAHVGGIVHDDGNAGILERGICWSTHPNPALVDSVVPGALHWDDSKVDHNQIIAKVEGLEPGRLYYYRAFATNSAGTGYGKVKSFIARETISGIYTDPRGGNTYNMVTISNQVWMAECLFLTQNHSSSSIRCVKELDF